MRAALLGVCLVLAGGSAFAAPPVPRPCVQARLVPPGPSPPTSVPSAGILLEDFWVSHVGNTPSPLQGLSPAQWSEFTTLARDSFVSAMRSTGVRVFLSSGDRSCRRSPPFLFLRDRCPGGTSCSPRDVSTTHCGFDGGELAPPDALRLLVAGGMSRCSRARLCSDVVSSWRGNGLLAGDGVPPAAMSAPACPGSGWAAARRAAELLGLEWARAVLGPN